MPFGFFLATTWMDSLHSLDTSTLCNRPSLARMRVPASSVPFLMPHEAIVVLHWKRTNLEWQVWVHSSHHQPEPHGENNAIYRADDDACESSLTSSCVRTRLVCVRCSLRTRIQDGLFGGELKNGRCSSTQTDTHSPSLGPILAKTSSEKTWTGSLWGLCHN